jgi:AbrB family looped-hinge helix DNA binding protein
MNTVGTKGQVVIEKAIRDKLGIGPGWTAVQRLVDNKVEIRFVPPEHDRSAFGVLRQYVKRSPVTDDEMDEAFGDAVVEEYVQGLGDDPPA